MVEPLRSGVPFLWTSRAWASPESAQDVLAFLPNPADADRIRLFPEFIQTAPCRSEPCLLVELYRQERRPSR
jgi:hypothetical protein